MIASICFLSCALTLGQTTDRAEWQLTPQLAPGLELVYRGTFVDEALIPNVQHQRQYQLETTLLILSANAKECPAVLMTSLALQDGIQLVAKKEEAPTSVRLELVNVDIQGRVRFDEKKLLSVPLSGPPTLEAGFLAPAPLVRVGRHFVWQVGEEGRPAQRWQVVGSESCGGFTCVKLACVQQSEDWEKPRADQIAWRRSDTVWLRPQLNVAHKVERIIERRDPARLGPTHRTVARYELENPIRYPSGMFEERKQELMQARKFYVDAEPLVAKPAQFRLEIDGLLQRVNTQLKRPGTLHYPRALLHVKHQLESAKQGDAAAPRAVEDAIPSTVQALAVGQKAPDFAVSSLTAEKTARLQSYLGKPVLVVFYNPATQTGREVITYAKALSEQHSGVAIMAMAVTQDADLVRKQHQEMRLQFHVLDGNGMRLTFGALQTPRVVLLDGDGMVRLTQTGWGYHSPEEIQRELQRCFVVPKR